MPDLSELDHWFAETLLLAQKAAEQDEVPVGAIVVTGNKIVGRGYNLRESKQDPLAHAEILAVEDAVRSLGSWRLNECTLIVSLEPCLMCLGAIQQARVGKVFYGAKDLKGGALSLGYRPHEDSRLNHRFPVEFRDTPECGKILTDFFQRKRQKK